MCELHKLNKTFASDLYLVQERIQEFFTYVQKKFKQRTDGGGGGGGGSSDMALAACLILFTNIYVN